MVLDRNEDIRDDAASLVKKLRAMIKREAVSVGLAVEGDEAVLEATMTTPY